MSTDDRRNIWETYASAWKATGAKAKAAALSTSVADHAVYRDPLCQAEGHDKLIEYMTSFHEQVPGGHFETTYFQAHHDRSVAKWNLRNGQGLVVGEGVSYGEYDADGKLASMTGFFESPPR